MKKLTVKPLTADQVEFEVECLPEDISVEGNFASGDEEADREMERRIMADLESGNEWAWCTVRVTARYGDFEGVDYLGACSYASKADFCQPGCYFDDMKKEALDDLNRKVRAAVEKIIPLVECR